MQNISCAVRNSAKRGEKVHLLKNVSGCVVAGEMTALVRAGRLKKILRYGPTLSCRGNSACSCGRWVQAEVARPRCWVRCHFIVAYDVAFRKSVYFTIKSVCRCAGGPQNRRPAQRAGAGGKSPADADVYETPLRICGAVWCVFWLQHRASSSGVMQGLASVRMLTRVLVADTLIDNLTVQEMLLYTAELKLKATVPLEAKLRRVDTLIAQLALELCRHVRIGNAMKRGISGWWHLRKRCVLIHHFHDCLASRWAGEAHQYWRCAHQRAPRPFPGRAYFGPGLIHFPGGAGRLQHRCSVHFFLPILTCPQVAPCAGHAACGSAHGPCRGGRWRTKQRHDHLRNHTLANPGHVCPVWQGDYPAARPDGLLWRQRCARRQPSAPAPASWSMSQLQQMMCGPWRREPGATVFRETLSGPADLSEQHEHQPRGVARDSHHQGVHDTLVNHPRRLRLCVLQRSEVLLRLQADRDGRAAEFAAAYAGSELCRANLQLVMGAAGVAAASRGGIGRFRAAGSADVPGSGAGELTQEDVSELATRNETTTSIWWGYKTLIKVPVMLA